MNLQNVFDKALNNGFDLKTLYKAFKLNRSICKPEFTPILQDVYQVFLDSQ